jgi:hypothetical protein
MTLPRATCLRGFVGGVHSQWKCFPTASPVRRGVSGQLRRHFHERGKPRCRVGDYEFSGVRFASWTPSVRKLIKRRDAAIDYQRNTAGGRRGILLFDVIANAGEVAYGRLCPADLHQPGNRLSISLPTSSCSTNSPRSAAAKPFSTSRTNHSSWLTNRSTASCTRD